MLITSCRSALSKPPLPAAHYKWNTAAEAHNRNRFESLSDSFMTDLMVSTASGGQKSCESFVDEFQAAVTRAADRTIGRRLVSARTKPGFGKDLKCLVQRRRNLLRDLRKSGGANTRLHSFLDSVSSKVKLITKSMRKEAQLKFCREVESDPTGKLLWTKWRQRAQAGSSELPSVVLDKDETLVVDPVKVRATWASYVERLGLEDTILEDATESNEEIQDILHERLQDVGDSIRKDAPRNKFDDLYARRVVDALTRLDPYTRVVPELDRQISWKEVWKTIAGLPRGKAAGEDGITAD